MTAPSALDIGAGLWFTPPEKDSCNLHVIWDARLRRDSIGVVADRGRYSRYSRYN